MTRRIFLCCLALAAPAALWARTPVDPYKGAIIMDAASGRILFADNADEISPPASMTKLMTYAVLADALKAGRLTLETPLRATSEEARVAALRDSTKVNLRAGEVFSVDELVYAMMLQSANDAAYLVARSVGGSVPAFVEMMNAKARSLGMTRSTFRTPNGFPWPSHRIADGDLTTPRDYALLSRYLIAHTDILRYTSVKRRQFARNVRFPAFIMVNHDNLLGRVDGVDGLKTGFTNGAGFCLAATAHRGGRRVIVVVMGSPSTRDRDLAVTHLIQRGFDRLNDVAGPAPAGQHLFVAPTPPPAGANLAPANAPSASEPPPIHFTIPGQNN